MGLTGRKDGPFFHSAALEQLMTVYVGLAFIAGFLAGVGLCLTISFYGGERE